MFSLREYIRAGLWLFGLSLLLWYPMRWWPGDYFLPVQLLNYFMPWLLVTLLPGLLIAGLIRDKGLLAILAIPTVLIIFTFAPLFLPRPDAVLAKSSSFKVMSFNVWSRNHDFEELMQVIKTEQPDLVLLQELYLDRVPILKEKLGQLDPDREFDFYYEPDGKQAIISYYAITPLGFSLEQGQVQKAMLETPNGEIMIWNVHVFKPRYWSLHYSQMVNLAAAVAEVEQPLIVAGDFNTTDQSETFRMINQYLTNGHWQSGWGFGFSYPARNISIQRFTVPTVSVVRIDHIFYSDHFSAFDAYTVDKNGGSDHFPVVADLLRVE